MHTPPGSIDILLLWLIWGCDHAINVDIHGSVDQKSACPSTVYCFDNLFIISVSQLHPIRVHIVGFECMDFREGHTSDLSLVSFYKLQPTECYLSRSNVQTKNSLHFASGWLSNPLHLDERFIDRLDHQHIPGTEIKKHQTLRKNSKFQHLQCTQIRQDNLSPNKKDGVAETTHQYSRKLLYIPHKFSNSRLVSPLSSQSSPGHYCPPILLDNTELKLVITDISSRIWFSTCNLFRMNECTFVDIQNCAQGSSKSERCILLVEAPKVEYEDLLCNCW